MNPAAPTAPAKPVNEAWTVRGILEWTTKFLAEKGSENPRVDAEVLMSHAWGCDRILLYTRFREEAPEAVRTKMRSLVQRRAASEPVAYLVGHKEFFSLKFAVDKNVLVPRPETEFLAALALDELKLRGAEPTLCDLGTGSGCLAVTIAKHAANAHVVAVDVSEAAAAIATANAARHEVADRVDVLVGDLFAPLDGRRFDLIVSNPPYVRDSERAELAADVRDHEPAVALFGGADGLDVTRRLVADAPRHLVPGGWIGLELDPAQMKAVSDLLQSAGFVRVQTHRDAAGRERVITAALSTG